MPNQLIQKPRKENKNLCPKCQKKDNCEDFKRLEYVEVCEDYKRSVLCDTCIKKDGCSLPKSPAKCWDNGNDVVNVLKECLLYKRDTFKGNKAYKSICDDCVKIDKCVDHVYGINRIGCDNFVGELKPALNYDIANKDINSEQPKDKMSNVKYKYVEDKEGDYYCWQNKGENKEHFSHKDTLKNFKSTFVKRSDRQFWNSPLKFDENPSHIVYYKKVIQGNNGIVTEPIVTKEISVKVEVFKDIGEELQLLGFEKGVKSFNGLKSEYDSVSKIFAEYRNTKNSLIDVPKVQKSTNEIYGKGIKFLRLIADIFKQLNVTKYDDLVAENEELKVSLNDCKNKESALYKTLKTAIDKNQKNLDLMKENKDRISELLGQVSLCKDAIMEVRLGLPELLNHQSTDELNKVILSSKDRISFGQRLLDEYKREGL